MRATQTLIAACAGVTQRTVSRCFIDPESVHWATRERVFSAARKLGYKPNAAARHMRTGRFDCVAILTDGNVTRPRIHPHLLCGACRRLSEQGRHLLLAEIHEGAQGADAVMPELFHQDMVDGLVVNYGDMLPKWLEQRVAALSLPSVWVNTRRKVDCVVADDQGGSRKAVEHLLTLGHRRIACLDASPCPASNETMSSARRSRVNGYRDAMKAAGREPQLIRARRPLGRDEHVGLVRDALDRARRPTAILAIAPADSLATVCAAGLAGGLKIPRDLSLIGFDDEPGTRFPYVATVVMPWLALGTAAADMLAHKLKNGNQPLPPQSIATEFAPGQTLSAPA